MTATVWKMDGREGEEAGKSVKKPLQEYRLKEMVTGTKGVARKSQNVERVWRSQG